MPGYDKILNMILQSLPRKALTAVATLMSFCLTHSFFPKLWKRDVIIKARKDNRQMSSYRPISLLSKISKIFEKIIKSEARKYSYQKQHHNRHSIWIWLTIFH